MLSGAILVKKVKGFQCWGLPRFVHSAARVRAFRATDARHARARRHPSGPVTPDAGTAHRRVGARRRPRRAHCAPALGPAEATGGIRRVGASAGTARAPEAWGIRNVMPKSDDSDTVLMRSGQAVHRTSEGPGRRFAPESRGFRGRDHDVPEIASRAALARMPFDRLAGPPVELVETAPVPGFDNSSKPTPPNPGFDRLNPR
jgi:hypothetical protein